MEHATVYFDGACPLCRREIGALRRFAGERLRFIDVSPEDAAEACPLPRETLMARFHAADRHGEVTEGADAFLLAWSAVPGLSFLDRLRSSRLIVKALDRAYGVFLRIRPRLQRLLT
jgi:predicted DCC family thiol-disulfide oxidoreductase YuxK